MGELRRRTADLVNAEHQRILDEVYTDFPDSEEVLRRQGLGFTAGNSPH
ncbi:hypothetical protein [Halomonas sp. M4R1S46]|nr:hypothetical protein [Halomonas sp. M4R1S46]UYG08987.1 hypothetical protein OCT48_06560 [Halomonas sp. M4R1S46]